MRDQPSVWRRYLSVILHAALVTAILLTLAGLDLAHHPATDANLGGGLAILLLAELGLPWSTYLLQANSMGDMPIWQQDAIWAVTPVLNVLLHLGAVVVVTRLREQRARPSHTQR